MTDYDFRQHIGEWVETRGGDRVKVIGYNSEAPEYCQLVVQYLGGDTSTRNVNGQISQGANGADVFDLVLPVSEYTTRVKLFRHTNRDVSAIFEIHWSFFETHDPGLWISEPTEVTFKLLPGVKLP